MYLQYNKYQLYRYNKPFGDNFDGDVGGMQ